MRSEDHTASGSPPLVGRVVLGVHGGWTIDVGESVMAVSDVQVTCDGASGSAAPFVVSVSVGGEVVRQEDVTGQPVPREGGAWWSWSVSWQLEGPHTLTVTDTTHDGAQTWEVETYVLDCPAPTTTTVPETTVVTTVPTTVEPTTTVPVPETTPQPTTVETVPEPTVTVPASVDTSPAPTVTEVRLTAPAPVRQQSTVPAPTMPADLYVISTDGTLVEPVGCCADYAAETVASTVLPSGRLPETGGAVAPLLGVGSAIVAAGALAAFVARRPRPA